MALAYLNSLAAFTITYNGVQFGGSDSSYHCFPPTYRLRGEMEYDDARRAVKGVRYVLNVTTVFYYGVETALADEVTKVRRLLSAKGKELKIEGLGIGFGAITSDIDGGPYPLGFEWTPIGQLAWECSWTVSFFTKPCAGNTVRQPLAIAAFNFDTTWQNDFEGLCERTISGYAEIALTYNSTGKTPSHVADEIRDNIGILCPPGFKRVRNVWRETAAKNRLEFVITDEMMSGSPYPVGCSHAEGEFSYSSQGPGFAQAVCTLSMNLRVSPSFAPAHGGVIFLMAAKAKQDAMTQGLSGKPKAVAVPHNIYIRNGKFDRARETTASMSWILTKCVGDMMSAAGIWEPVVSNNYAQWRTSIENLWTNRGAAMINGGFPRSLAQEAVVIDLCDNVTQINIGDTPYPGDTPSVKPPFTFTCPNIPEDGGWIGHDLRIRFYRQDNQSWHRKATAYQPSPGQTSSGSANGDRVPVGGPVYSQGGQDTASQHDVEYHGLPEVYLLVEFRGLRIKHKPSMPELKTVAGNPVYLYKQEIDGPKIAFDSVGCPVWFIRGYRLYRVNGYVPDMKAVESETSCAAPNGSNQDQ